MLLHFALQSATLDTLSFQTFFLSPEYNRRIKIFNKYILYRCSTESQTYLMKAHPDRKLAKLFPPHSSPVEYFNGKVRECWENNTVEYQKLTQYNWAALYISNGKIWIWWSYHPLREGCSTLTNCQSYLRAPIRRSDMKQEAMWGDRAGIALVVILCCCAAS